MNRLFAHAPLLFIVGAMAVLALHGPIVQWPDYHRFADTRPLLGLPNALDVLSNFGFAAVALWGWIALVPRRHEPALADGWPGWALFLAALMLTAIGSTYYHLAPDNFRLLLDRLPIALACAGLLDAVYAETHSSRRVLRTVLLALVAIASVLWWYSTELAGEGDLRPYLLLQFAPLVLIPMWQALHASPRHERIAFACAIGAYALAKLVEIGDHQILHALGLISGHTLKHLLATAAAGILIGGIIARCPGVAVSR